MHSNSRDTALPAGGHWKNVTAGDFWNHMVEAGQNSTVSLSVVINPNSGPGDSAEDEYSTGITDLTNAGVEVRCGQVVPW